MPDSNQDSIQDVPSPIDLRCMLDALAWEVLVKGGRALCSARNA